MTTGWTIPETALDLVKDRAAAFREPFAVTLDRDGLPPRCEAVEDGILLAAQRRTAGRKPTVWDERWQRYADARAANRPHYAVPPKHLVKVAQALLVFYTAALFGRQAMADAVKLVGAPEDHARALSVADAEHDADAAMASLQNSGGSVASLELDVLAAWDLKAIPYIRRLGADDETGALDAARQRAAKGQIDSVAGLMAAELGKGETPATMNRMLTRGAQFVRGLPGELIEALWRNLSRGRSGTAYRGGVVLEADALHLARIEARERFAALVLEAEALHKAKGKDRWGKPL
ncbi:MAG: hypothetical protein IOD03_07535 [Methylocystis sp.]|nr:hypothetical protein [Rhodobacter sp.]MCA3583526.1 hypothetical protein [Methylocystis sp.]MCA3461534.1 hypothetical protein [Rhodobacter sp.]MCA3464460.1 hypothetical protein [Rhodobacter sp.]MCA3466269.1 hypothetical protein [Rhodobacter sp.]